MAGGFALSCKPPPILNVVQRFKGQRTSAKLKMIATLRPPMVAKSLLLLLALASTPLSALVAREKLEGVSGMAFGSTVVDGLAFGSTLATAQKWGGGRLKEERRQLNDGREVSVLTSADGIMLYGRFYFADFVFGDEDRFSRVNFLTVYYLGEHCAWHGNPTVAQIIAAYGQPDQDVTDERHERRVLMTFRDGGEIQASYVTRGIGDCAVRISFASAKGKASDLKGRR